MKIAFLNVESGLGGAERCLLDLLSSLPGQLPAVETHFIELSPGPLGDHIRKLNVAVTRLPLPDCLRNLGDSGLKGNSSFVSRIELAANLVAAARSAHPYARLLNETIEGLKPDLIHSNGIKSHLLLALAGVKAPVVWHIHDFIGSRPLVSRLIRRISKHPSCIVANSKAVASDAERVTGRPVEWIHNGVDTAYFSPGHAPLAGNLGTGEEGRLKVGMVATYAKWKGHFLFLDAIARLSRNPLFTPIDYFIIGGPIYKTPGSQVSREELNRHAHKLGIENHVNYIGFQENIVDAYRSLDIVIHASTEPEPFGRTIVEAMACGRPVIVSTAGGASELFREGHDAIGFRMGDAESLAQNIRRLVSNPELRESLAINARATAVARFSKEKYVAEMVSKYQSTAVASMKTRDTTLASNGRRKRLDSISHDLVIAMGYQQDNWRSSKYVAEGLIQGLRQQLSRFPEFSRPYLHAPHCHQSPKWFDRRLTYGRTLPRGHIFQLVDQSYGDALISARHRFEALVTLIIDIAFWSNRTPLNEIARRRILKGLALADRRITMSRAMAIQIESELGLEVHAIIPPGVDLDRFFHSEEPRDPFELLHVGTTDERKGVDRALRFLAGLPSPLFRLVHVGSPLTKAQREMALKLGVRDRVVEHIDANLAQLVQHYHRASVVLIPSRYEGFGLPAIEGRLCGTTVILSDSVPAIEQLQKDPGTLQIDFRAFDEQGAQAHRDDQYEKFNRFSRMANGLQERASYGWTQAATQYCKIYESLELGKALSKARPYTLG